MGMKKKGMWQLLLVILSVTAVVVWGYLGYTDDRIPGVQDIKLGLDLNGGVSVTYETVKEKPTDEEMADTLEKLQKRAEAMSAESAVFQEGANRINVDIPGVDNAEQVLETLGSAGNIYFIYAMNEDGTANIEATDVDKYVLARPMEDIIADGDVVLDGTDISNAKANIIDTQEAYSSIQNIVEFKLKDSGKKKFEEATRWAQLQSGLQKRIAIVYDGEVYSAPVVSSTITNGEAYISGCESFEEAQDLATIIRIGALPIELKSIRSNIVGATLGERALVTSLIAGAIGFVLVCLFMIVVYRLPGVAASISLVIYLGVVLLMLLAFDVTLTLPGIAGIILSVGMAVDANVIIFTRIKEEIATGKTVRSSIKIGYHKALSAIIDGNVTTLIAAVVLYFLGSGVIKGFATTLAIGILVSMFTSLVITWLIMQTFFNLGATKTKYYGKAKPAKRIDFLRHWKKYLCISGAMILLCVAMLFVNKGSIGNILNYGLDFVGGTSVQITFEGELPTNGEMESFVSETIGESVTVSEVKGENALILKTKAVLDDEGNLQKMKEAFRKQYGVAEDAIETETISGSVSERMKTDAIMAVLIATVCMLLYIWIRFKNISFATASVLALVHDVIVVLGVYALARITVDNTFIACMLTIVGYSINATIVIFDRIREGYANMLNKESLADVVNESISQTLSRSIHTSLTTLLTVVVLIILGVDAIRVFAIPLAVGILCGGYSSVCIAGSLWYWFKMSFHREAGTE